MIAVAHTHTPMNHIFIFFLFHIGNNLILVFCCIVAAWPNVCHISIKMLENKAFNVFFFSLNTLHNGKFYYPKAMLSFIPLGLCKSIIIYIWWIIGGSKHTGNSLVWQCGMWCFSLSLASLVSPMLNENVEWFCVQCGKCILWIQTMMHFAEWKSKIAHSCFY